MTTAQKLLSRRKNGSVKGGYYPAYMTTFEGSDGEPVYVLGATEAQVKKQWERLSEFSIDMRKVKKVALFLAEQVKPIRGAK